MFTTTHKLATVVATLVTASALGVLQASAAPKQDFVRYSVAGGTPLASTFSQPGVADLDW
jgi:hypothetical protein